MEVVRLPFFLYGRFCRRRPCRAGVLRVFFCRPVLSPPFSFFTHPKKQPELSVRAVGTIRTGSRNYPYGQSELPVRVAGIIRTGSRNYPYGQSELSVRAVGTIRTGSRNSPYGELEFPVRVTGVPRMGNRSSPYGNTELPVGVAGAARRGFPEGAVTPSARGRGGAAGAGFRAASCIIVAPRAAVWAKKRTCASGNGRTNGLWTRLRREFWWA